MVKQLHILANPLRFAKLGNAIMPIASVMAIAALAVGLYGGLVLAPPDYLQGDAMRIMYVHVPSAWMAMMVYAGMALCSAGFLIWRHPVADFIARGASPVGACFTVCALITGMLWGKPAWGAAWVWDARLTSVLILFFLYVGHMILLQSFDDMQKSSKFGAILAIIGAINLPIIKYSVDWWNTLHQTSSISSLSRLASPSITFDMLWPLLMMALGFLCLAIALILRAAQIEMGKRRLLMAYQRKVSHG
ncbi:MAG: heme ABC transporter permease [Alphaproteobacteria bacterium]|nr:MAG: heme ABC transporter permease [Alphaproteobacteria bacterium]